MPPTPAVGMRALTFTGPAPDTSTTRVAVLPVPEPGPGQVSIDVHYAGLNFKDVMARRGDQGYAATWPFVPGLDVSGVVRRTGHGVTGLRVGDRVAALTGTGGLAEVAVADAALTVRVPRDLGLPYAAAAPGALTSAALVLDDLARLRPGETVLVHGATGGVGQAAARLARLAGAGRVLGTVGDPRRRPAAGQGGYDTVLSRDADWADAARRATAGRGVDVIIDPQGTTLIDPDLAAAAPGARIVLIGNATGAPPAPLPALGRLMAANATITGFSLAALAAAAPARVAAALAAVLDRMAAGELDVDLTILDGLASAPAGHQALTAGRARGKQVVRVHGARPHPGLTGRAGSGSPGPSSAGDDGAVS